MGGETLDGRRSNRHLSFLRAVFTGRMGLTYETGHGLLVIRCIVLEQVKV
jgi:hypothetical protein